MRILTFALAILSPIIGALLSIFYLVNKTKYSVFYAMILALTFASMAYAFIPNHDIDLVRYYQICDNIAEIYRSEGIISAIFTDYFFVINFLFLIIGVTGKYSLLPFITMFIVYFIAVYMIADYSKRNNSNPLNIFISLIVLIGVLSFPAAVSNVRNVLAFSIFIFALYRDLVQGKKNIFTLILYVTPVFIHISTIVLLFIRTMSLFSKTRKKLLLQGLSIILIVPIILVTVSLIDISIFEKIPIISDFILKTINYISDNTSEYALYNKSSTFMRMQKAFYISFTIFILFLSLFSKALRQKYYKLYTFFLLSMCLVIGTIGIVLPVYMRFTYVIVLLSFLVFLNVNNIQNIKSKVYRQIIFIFTLIFVFSGVAYQLSFLNEIANIKEIIKALFFRGF